ncbi:hypothetical protein [Francisella persica]|uniref:hypothetical protein n=1 Tax=Francisella persica TaxID=954 RepID=UPI000A9763FB|nr:hypothetical protein [Francisella persica]
MVISLTSIGFSKELNSYPVNAVKAGKNTTTVVINFPNCKPEIKAFGQFSPKSIIIHSNSILLDVHFTRK